MQKDNVELICNVAELAGLFEKSSSLEDFLHAVVSTVAFHMKAAVCSIYLYEADRDELVLRANQGLNPESVGRLRMKLGEGIVGTALKELRPIRESRGSQNPYFKFFSNINEETYEAFLAVPILRGLTRIGVLSVQDVQEGYFHNSDTRALQAIAAQLATTIENANLLMGLHGRGTRTEAVEEPVAPVSYLVKGKSVSEGACFGRVTQLGQTSVGLMEEDPLGPEVRTEADFQRTLEETERQLVALQERTEEMLSDVSSLIFSAHMLMLRDSAFSGAMLERIREGATPARAVVSVVNEYIQLFSKSENPMIREKVSDVKDLGHRLLHNLAQRAEDEKEYQGEIVVSTELLPSDMLKLVAQGAEGIVLVGGSTTSHVSILARSLGVPMVIVDDRRVLSLDASSMIQLDAFQGNVYINPPQDVCETFKALRETGKEAEQLEKDARPETYTRDGTRVRILANINLVNDLDLARRLKTEGVGLYRSEFPFIVRDNFPSEEEQQRIYRTVVEAMPGKEVILRTLDIGGDKMLSYYPNVNEGNPFLGLRAIRFSFRNRQVFNNQLRAMLRAGTDADMGILFPLVSSVDDFLQARDVVQECAAALDEEGIPHHPGPRLGAMIELPSAVEVSEELAQEADFLSVGSTDLVQYILGVDRTNDDLSDMYLFHHPAVLRALNRVVAAANRHGTPISLCGDMLGDLKLVPFLLGIGLRSFSVDARRGPRLQAVLSEVDLGAAQEEAQRMLAMGTVREVDLFIQQTPEAGPGSSS